MANIRTESHHAPSFFISFKLCINLRHSRWLPTRVHAMPVSYNSEVHSKSGGIHWLRTFVEAASIMEVENDAFLRVTSIKPGWPPANPIETQTRNLVGTLILLVSKKLLERFSFSIISEAQPTLKSECSHDFMEQQRLGVEIGLGTPRAT